jgi:hypothetical protein
MDEKKRVRPFGWPPEPIETLIIDASTMNRIRDVANDIWQKTRAPNANLIMFEALRQVMEQAGAKANFTVNLEV